LSPCTPGLVIFCNANPGMPAITQPLSSAKDTGRPEFMNALYLKSSQSMSEIADQSIRLIVTSPPYFNVKDYGMDDQIGKSSHSYEHYIESMLPVWKECYRILKPNGKLCINSPIMPMEKKVYSTHYNRDILNINNDIEQSILGILLIIVMVASSGIRAVRIS
jgi:DNA modification methylase